MYFKSFICLRKDQKAFTLMELIVIIALLAILITIAIPTYIGITENAKISVLGTNMSGVRNLFLMSSIKYDKTEWYGAWNEDGDGTLNNHMEKELEIVNGGHYKNNSNIINPYSQNMSILDYNTTLSSGDGYRPAVFLTANSSYAYTGKGSTKNLIGTIVAFFQVKDGATEYIEFYYINKDGTKSEDTLKI